MTVPNVTQIRQFSRAVFADRYAMRAFIHVWRMATSGKGEPPALFSDEALIGSLPPPPSEDRMMLLLVDVMGMSVTEAGDILSPMKDSAEEALEKGRSLIAQPRVGKVLIIEDEPLIAADIREILVSMGVEVCGEVRSAPEAINATSNMLPDLILADYNLEGPDTGADAINVIQEDHDCRVIFITGYPQKVLTGEDVEPDFVLGKPYRVEGIKAAVAHCLDVMTKGALA